MPTGYTAGILDGEITTFPQFAEKCMRAFGATIHMRDDRLDAKYTPRIPTDYHIKAIKEANEKLASLKKLSDKKIISSRRKELLTDKKHYLGYIKKAKAGAKKLNKILNEVNNWVPPTDEHVGIKNFMYKQITETLDFDCNPRYYEEELSKIDEKLKKLNPKKIRKEIIDKAKRDLEYHTKEHNAEVKRCEDSNKWVNDFIKSL